MYSPFLQDALVQVQDSTALSQITGESPRSILEFIALAGGFEWPILGVFVLGLGALMHTLVRLYQDDRQSRELRQMDMSGMITKDIRNAAKLPGQSVYHSILSGLTRHGQFAPDHGGRIKTVAAAVAAQQEAFTLTHRLVIYCSGAAGGLGLAGTMVGMYLSFAAAGTDPRTVFTGISLALVSTLLGVVASLILEAANTFVNHFASKYLAQGREWGEDVCVRLSSLSRTAARMKSQRRAAPKKSPTKSNTSK